jgi:hypothetical protein
MSWGALPWWVYEVGHERSLAMMSCAFEAEWFSGTSKVMPKHIISTSRATFETWNNGGWNYRLSEEFA